MKRGLEKLFEYLPDRTVLDERPAFDDDLSAPFFHPGNAVGCLVLHGIGGTPANVRAVSDRLAAEGYTVLSPVLPGHRETVRALNASSDADWKQCVFSAYDRLAGAGAKRIYVLGLSLGGLLAIKLAEEKPVSGLVVFCAPIETRRFLRIARHVSFILPFVRFPSNDKPDSWRQNPYAQMYDGFSTTKLWDLVRLSKEVTAGLDRITCPALWFSAKFDDKVSEQSVAIFEKKATRLAAFTHVHLENSPHGCTYGPERDDIAAKTAEFIQAIETEHAHGADGTRA